MGYLTSNIKATIIRYGYINIMIDQNPNNKLLSKKVKKLYRSGYGIRLSNLDTKKVLDGLVNIVKRSGEK